MKDRDPIREAIRKAQRDLADDLGMSPDSLARAIMDGAGDLAGVLVFDNSQAEEPRGPFVFYEAKPVRASAEQRAQMIAHMQAIEPSMTREEAERVLDDAQDEALLLSTEYQVAMREVESGFGHDVLHLSIKRLDREPIHDWRALQQIKNAIVGEECEAIEIYPAESRLVDTANQYHLWAFMDQRVRVPVGFVGRVVDEASVGNSKQRPFQSRDALMPSRAELEKSLRELSEWMRDNTGPSDGTLEMLQRAVALLEKIDKARIT